MRRVIVNRIYAGENIAYSPGVVELYGDRVSYYYPITDDDLPEAEWIGGTVFVGSVELQDIPKELNLTGMRSLLSQDMGSCLYAYHLPLNYDLNDNRLSSHLIPLEDDDY